MRWRGLTMGLAIIAVAPPALAQRAASIADQLAVSTEKIGLQGRKGPSLLRPGFAVGEYVGSAYSRGSSVRAVGSYSKDKMASDFNVTAPSLGGEVSAECRGRQGRLGLGWITFKREGLELVCTYGGAAPADAELDLAMSRGGGIINRLSQSQRAGELRWGRITLRARTEYLGGLPGGGGAPASYVITRPDGQVVGGMQKAGLRPTFYLPKTPGPERDAVAILALSLFQAQDPGDDRP